MGNSCHSGPKLVIYLIGSYWNFSIPNKSEESPHRNPSMSSSFTVDHVDVFKVLQCKASVKALNYNWKPFSHNAN